MAPVSAQVPPSLQNIDTEQKWTSQHCGRPRPRHFANAVGTGHIPPDYDFSSDRQTGEGVSGFNVARVEAPAAWNTQITQIARGKWQGNGALSGEFTEIGRDDSRVFLEGKGWMPGTWRARIDPKPGESEYEWIEGGDRPVDVTIDLNAGWVFSGTGVRWCMTAPIKQSFRPDWGFAAYDDMNPDKRNVEQVMPTRRHSAQSSNQWEIFRGAVLQDYQRAREYRKLIDGDSYAPQQGDSANQKSPAQVADERRRQEIADNQDKIAERNRQTRAEAETRQQQMHEEIERNRRKNDPGLAEALGGLFGAILASGKTEQEMERERQSKANQQAPGSTASKPKPYTAHIPPNYSFTFGPRIAAGTTGLNATRVTTPYSYFFQSAPGKWIEGFGGERKSKSYVETGRTERSVFLEDTSSDLALELDLGTMKVKAGEIGGALNEVTELTDSFHPPAGYYAAAPGDEPFTVSGFDAQRIVFNGKIYQPASEGDRWDVTMLGHGSAGSFAQVERTATSLVLGSSTYNLDFNFESQLVTMIYKDTGKEVRLRGAIVSAE